MHADDIRTLSDVRFSSISIPFRLCKINFGLFDLSSNFDSCHNSTSREIHREIAEIMLHMFDWIKASERRMDEESIGMEGMAILEASSKRNLFIKQRTPLRWDLSKRYHYFYISPWVHTHNGTSQIQIHVIVTQKWVEFEIIWRENVMWRLTRVVRYTERRE